MKRMAALLAVMGALSAIVPAAAPAADAKAGGSCATLLMIRLC